MLVYINEYVADQGTDMFGSTSQPAQLSADLRISYLVQTMDLQHAVYKAILAYRAIHATTMQRAIYTNMAAPTSTTKTPRVRSSAVGIRVCVQPR